MDNAIDFSVRPQGYFKLSTNLRGQIAEFPNLILNSGLNLLATHNSYIEYCFVGTGNTPPTVNDTNMESFVASTNIKTINIGGVSTSAPYYSYQRIVFRFNAGATVGNLAEVGVGVSSSGNRILFCRTLIKDSFGNPTTITLLPDEILEVTYELRHYVPVGDSTGTITLTGNIGGTYDYILRPSKVTSYHQSVFTGWSGDMNYRFNYHSFTYAYSGGLGPITGSPTGSYEKPTSSKAESYVTDTYSAAVTYFFGVDAGNIPGGIKSIGFVMGTGCYQVEFTPPIPKTNQDSLSLTFGYSWARKS